MLSVVVITRNEEGRIKTCLESVKWADEILVLDNGSNDKTLEIAKQYTDKIFTSKDSDFSSLRNKAFEESKGDWILYIDSDERVLASLKEELLQIIQKDQYSAVAISRINIVFGQRVSYKAFKPDWVIRLLKRKDFDTWVGKVHEYPKFSGKLGYSKHSLLHLTHRNIDQIVFKSLEWSKIDAKLRFEAKHPKMNGWRFIRIFFSELFNQGIKREGFFGGTVGVIDAILQTFSMFITYVRLWQLQQNQPLDKTYNDIDKKLLEDNFKYP